MNCAQCGRELSVKAEVPSVENDDLRAACESLFAATSASVLCSECWDKRERDEAAKISADMAKRRAEIMERSGLPVAMYLDYDHRLGNAALLAWVKSNTLGSIWLQGLKSGVGKTRTLVYVAGKIIDRHGANVRFYKASSLLRAYSALLGVSVSAASEMVDDIVRCDLLVIDDLGKDKITDRGRELVFELVDRRYEAKRRIWLSTNFNSCEIEKHLGAHGVYVKRRLLQMAKIYDADTGTPIDMVQP